MKFLNFNRATIIFILMVLCSSSIFFTSCKDKTMDGMIIITRVAGTVPVENFASGNGWRYIPKTQIVAIDPKEGKESLKVLTGDYFSAQAPAISYDATHMLFSGQLKENDPWQIWEMDLENLKTRQITNSDINCTDPDYLPDGRIVYSKSENNDSLKAGHSLNTCKSDGSESKRITFNPLTYFASGILYDGRILTLGKQVFPQEGDQILMVMRPDGTKAEMFYNGDIDCNILTKSRETMDGKILFIESKNGKDPGGKLISITYNRPLHSRTDLAEGIEGDFISVFPVESGKLLVSFRKSNLERHSLYEFDLLNKALGKEIYRDQEFEVLDAIIVEQKTRPKKLPSEVDMEVKTGLLLCQDINVGDPEWITGDTALTEAYGIEVIGLDSSMGKVRVEKDGSFYLKVIADKPFRIQTIDKDGKILKGPGSWLYLRPLERRGCIGCHQDPELVPENKIPLAVKKDPVIIPVHLDKVVEKNVLLD
ncbi:MAG: hypothetical protein U0W24_09330 [Bacteroidales bacterium]